MVWTQHADALLGWCSVLAVIRHVWRWRRQEVISARRRERRARIISVGVGTLLEAFGIEAISRSNAAIQTLRRIH